MKAISQKVSSETIEKRQPVRQRKEGNKQEKNSQKLSSETIEPRAAIGRMQIRKRSRRNEMGYEMEKCTC
jgi:hypothetical protein